MPVAGAIDHEFVRHFFVTRGAALPELVIAMALIRGELVVFVLLLSSCSSGAGSATQPALSAGVGGSLPGVTPDLGAAGAVRPASAAGARAVAAGGAGAPAAVSGKAGMSAPAAVGGSGGSATAAAGMGGAASHDHCLLGQDADFRDARIVDQPEQWKASNGDIDLVLPKLVLDWMHERVWEESHDAWHNVRRCKGGGGIPGGMTSNICSHMELIPAHQECADADDGYQFLVVHRHMLQALRQAFPKQRDLFTGFPHFPYDAKDVPEAWRGRWGTGWSQKIKDTADTLEAIESHLSQFASEGELGRFIQCGGMASGASSIHGALHFKWVVNESPYSLGKQTVNIDNYMFWKLHGWIDQIWERYRVAKGVAASEPKLTQALVDQCREMLALGAAVGGGPKLDPNAMLPVEHGVFHEQVRPILERYCASCHSESSPEAMLSLGGHISSADVVKNLVGVQALHGGSFERVLAGKPDQSWLYLKVAGLAMNAGCDAVSCNNQVMPPTGQVTLGMSELMTIRQWISDGAAPP